MISSTPSTELLGYEKTGKRVDPGVVREACRKVLALAIYRLPAPIRIRFHKFWKSVKGVDGKMAKRIGDLCLNLVTRQSHISVWHFEAAAKLSFLSLEEHGIYIKAPVRLMLEPTCRAIILAPPLLSNRFREIFTECSFVEVVPSDDEADTALPSIEC